MNNTNLSNAIEALKHAIKAQEMAERSIGLAMQQINVADTEAVDPETIAVEIHDNQEYERGQKYGLTIARHFIRNWVREYPFNDSARYLAGDFDQEFFPETVMLSGMEGTPAKRFPWEITQAGL